ncbi:hypothetical protein [Teredinibacter purpureus]|nr:hypothetical protein [Teredinibacter purpureus]
MKTARMATVLAGPLGASNAAETVPAVLVSDSGQFREQAPNAVWLPV